MGNENRRTGIDPSTGHILLTGPNVVKALRSIFCLPPTEA